MPKVTYTVTDERGVEWRTNDWRRAERLSRAGLKVTGRMHAPTTVECPNCGRLVDADVNDRCPDLDCDATFH